MRVLGIDTDTEVMGKTEMLLKSAGFNYYHVTSEEEGIDLARHYPYDVIILDIGRSSIEVVRRMRQAKVMTPIIVLSDDTEKQHEVDALRFGVDDYVTKPYSDDVLIARINAVIRRRKGHARSLIEAGRLAINLDMRRAFVDAKHVALTKTEYRILQLLMLNKGSAISKDRVLQHLYDGQDEPDSNIIEACVCKMRLKLKRASGGTRFIETVWGQGYVIIDESSETPASQTPAGTRMHHANGAQMNKV
jgi:two-component system cell cycle response regulator CtrA